MHTKILGFGNPVARGRWKVWLCLPLLWSRCPEKAHRWRTAFWKEEVMSHEVTGCDGWCKMYYSTTLRLGEKGYEASKFICPLDYFILDSRLSFSIPINVEPETCHMWCQKNKKIRETVPTSLKVRHLHEGCRSQAQEENEPPSPTCCIYLNHSIEKSVRLYSNTRRARGKKKRKRKELTFHPLIA